MTNLSQLAPSTGTAATTNQFADVLVKKSQRLHTKSLNMLYRRFPQLAAYLDLIPKKVDSRTNWTPQVRRAIISISEALGADLTQYAPFDLSQPFNDQGVRRMLPRLALLVAGRLDADDECRRGLGFWLKHQEELRRQKMNQPVYGWEISVLYTDGATGPAFHPQTRR
jgi:hypothetical protein